MRITIVFEEPKKNEYYRHFHLDGECPPLKRGDPRSGDCIGCYQIEQDLYYRREKCMRESSGTKR